MNLPSTLSLTAIFGYLARITANLWLKEVLVLERLSRFCFSSELKRVSTGSRFQADASQREPAFAVRIEAENDFMTEPTPA